MLIREAPATELTIATRVLARAGALAPDARLTSLVGEVIYVAGRGVSAHTMTPYDVVALRLRDGELLHGTPPDDIDRYLAAHRQAPDARAVARIGDAFVTAASVPACVVLVLRGAPDDVDKHWHDAVAGARAAGALIGALPVGTDDG